ncbi:hypothetical protein MZUP3_080 [Erwinia phage vB_EhrS_49]|uniref:Uncharacterized protein n=2 Tax=Feofaniavirus TaxID=2733174 RepID=A0A4Y1NS66_9CAUD|nr:hypothetical protein HOV54_gp08 [Erwinia phage vB_EhrS_49]YP_009824038.1 hypothetical protein HOV55_gp08 [Erwinia phage vB_EhrS_59]AXH43439.1 hypothetical protein MZUP3_080 [Erwinia phage vB_EhrS_49]AXH43526.1 hypothetical protein MZUP2_080 [Erwinia phage vB_EhrS_59]
MALVKILVNNLFAGASFQKLEAGRVYDVDKSVAEKWIDAGKAEASKEKGEALTFEVATPSTPASTDTSVLQSQLDAANDQITTLTDAAEAKDKEHADALEAANAKHAEALAAETARADAAEAALADATKKAK